MGSHGNLKSIHVFFATIRVYLLGPLSISSAVDLPDAIDVRICNRVNLMMI